VKPFHRQHPVRGYFGDPRVGPDPDGTIHRTFHFGVDVSAPDGTPVYATASGIAAANSLHRDVVRIVRGDGVEFSYWHISPRVRPGQRVVAYETVIGRIEAGWGHVHFSEMRSGVFVNPLRPGAMGPYQDETCPFAKQVRFEHDGERLQAGSLAGHADIVIGALDPPAVSAPTPWRDLPVTPALVRWRIVAQAGRVIQPWQSALRCPLVAADWFLRRDLRHPHEAEPAKSTRDVPLPTGARLGQHDAPERRLHSRDRARRHRRQHEPLPLAVRGRELNQGIRVASEL
jgi:Peptidase family M23